MAILDFSHNQISAAFCVLEVTWFVYTKLEVIRPLVIITRTHVFSSTQVPRSVSSPPTPTDRRLPPDKLTLMAVNDTPIRTFGKRSLTLNLGLRRPFPWVFIVADVQQPILGADFLRHFGLLVDMKQRQLSDATTQLHVQGILSSDSSPNPTIQPKDTGDPYNKLLSKFPSLTQVCSQDNPLLWNGVWPCERQPPPCITNLNFQSPK